MSGEQFAQQCAGWWHLEKVAFSAGERHCCPYHLPLAAVQHLGVPQPVITSPSRRAEKCPATFLGEHSQQNVLKGFQDRFGKTWRSVQRKSSEEIWTNVFIPVWVSLTPSSCQENCKSPSHPAHIQWPRHSQAPAVPSPLLNSVFVQKELLCCANPSCTSAAHFCVSPC